MKKLLFLFVAGIISVNCFGQEPGDLDETFGNDGIVITDLVNDAQQIAFSIKQLQNQKILVGASVLTTTANNFALVRYEQNGTLDTSFGTNGAVLPDFEMALSDMIILPNGAILACGFYWDSITDQDFGLVKFSADGILDASFGNNGLVTTEFMGNLSEHPSSLVVQNDGKILLFGSTAPDAGSNGDFALARYNQDGTLDTSLDGDGMLTVDFGNDDLGISIALFTDGRILLGGRAFNTSISRNEFAMILLNPNGLVDTSFGTNGIVKDHFVASDSSLGALAIQNDGKIIAVSRVNPQNQCLFAVARYNPDGSLDTANFGTQGVVFTEFFTGNNCGLADATIMRDGKIVIAGIDYNGNDFDAVMVMHNSNGTLDTDFGTAGKVITDFGNNENEILGDLGIQQDDKILLAGTTRVDGDFSIGLARYHSALSLGINDKALSNIRLYPNPTKDRLFIDSEFGVIEQLTVYDRTGRQVLKQTPQGNSINVSILSQGLYFLEITIDTEKAIQKFIKN